MKKSISLILVTLAALFLVVCSRGSSSSELTISPEKAKPGDNVTFSYVPGNKDLATRDKFNLYVYSYSTELPQVTSIELKKSGKKWTGAYQIDKNAFGLIAKIKFDRENEDNNEGKGYIFGLYTPEGKILPGHKAGLALAYTSWGQLAGINQNLDEALRLTEEDFQTNPQIKKKFVNSYLRLLQTLKPEGWEKKTQAFLDEISTQTDLDDSTLTTLYRVYAQMGNQEKALAIFQQAQKNPKGEFFQIQALMQLQTIQDSKQRLEFFKKFQSEFPDSKYLETLTGMIAQSLLQETKLEEAINFLEENREKVQPYYFYAIASQTSQNEALSDLALKATDSGLSLLNEQLKNPEKYKPAYYTSEEWQESLESNLKPMFLDLKGNLLMKKGRKEEALAAYKEAFGIVQGEQLNISLDYSQALLQDKSYAEAKNVLESTARKGFTSQEVMNLLKQAYTGVNNSEEGWEKYQKEIENAALDFLKADLKKKMMEKPAPEFELKDLEGKVRKLSDYRGKVVVVDFWATWCGPCLGSFPGMKQLVEEYKEDPGVAFVFINTWQDEANKEQVVKEFLENNQYPFYVLMDAENKVVSQFGVTGIPTKFVIDPKGKIRFISVGFEGNTEKMVKEVKLMIDLVRGK